MDISRQSSMINDGLVEKKVTIIGETEKDKEYDMDVQKAMKLQARITDVLIEEEANMRMAYTVCVAMAESIYHYMMFGEKSDNV